LSIDAIKTVAVLGAGTMGNGIAHVFARSGYKVILRDVEQRFLARGLETIGKNLDREIEKGKLAQAEKGTALARLQPVTDMAAIAAADFVVEAVPEKIEIKRAVLTEADGILRPDVILASNTSSIGHSRAANERRDVLRDEGVGEEARQDAGGGQRRAGVRLQPRADAAHQ
jgi:3-hydroxybutyryl-CoA dehydrogenase